MKKWMKWVVMTIGVMMILWGLLSWAATGGNTKPIINSIVPTAIPTPTQILEKKYKIAVMADMHDDLISFKRGLELSKERGNELVVVAGDMTINGHENQLQKIKDVLEDSGVDYFVVPGNHDLYQGEGNYKRVFGKDYHSVYGGGEKIIMINNGSWKGLGQTQKQWIKTEVGECQKIKCLVVMHMPLNHNFSGHIMGEDTKVAAADAKELIKLFNDNNVDNVAVGHLHYSSSYELEGFRTTVVGAVSKSRNNQTPRHTEFWFEDGRLQKEVVLIL